MNTKYNEAIKYLVADVESIRVLEEGPIWGVHTQYSDPNMIVDEYISLLTNKLFDRVVYIMDPHQKNRLVSASFGKFKSRVKYETKHKDSLIKNLEITKKFMKHVQVHINDKEFNKHAQEIYNLADSYITAIKLM
ncbi:hypothetical protein D3C71_1132310 [compost metagenome]